MTAKHPVALIFGISGQTGAYLAHLLAAKGYRVHGVSRDSQNNEFRNLHRLGILSKIELHSASLTDFGSVFSILRRVAPDEVYNLAGQSSVALSFEQPLETFESVAQGTLNVLECLRAYEGHVKFFQATSSDCFGNTPLPAGEDAPFRPRSPYGMAKAAAFWAVASYRQSYGLHVCSGILSNHESPLRPAHFVTRKIIRGAVEIAADRSKRLKLGNLSVERDWGWAPDYANAIWRIVQHPVPDDYNVATGITTSLDTFVAQAFEKVGLDAKDHVDIEKSFFRPGEVERVCVSPEKARNTLGWSATITMPDLVAKLLECEQTGSVGIPI